MPCIALLATAPWSGSTGKVRIVSWSGDDAALFKQITLDALKWIEKHDARRFQRVQKHLRGIVDSDIEGYAFYSSSYQTCNVNVSKYVADWRELTPAHYEWYLTRYASSIIHEATHGYLRSLGFDYLKDNREQVERICHSEQIRFISRVRSEYYDYATDMVWPFDPSRWQEYWDRTWWGYVRRVFSKAWSKERPNRRSGNTSPSDTG